VGVLEKALRGRVVEDGLDGVRLFGTIHYCHVIPLAVRMTKMWEYTGITDLYRVSTAAVTDDEVWSWLDVVLKVGNQRTVGVAEPLELFRLKCANDHYAALIISTHFKRNNPLVCQVSARYNHGSTGSKQAYLARRRVYNRRTTHQLLIYRYPNIITNQVQTQINLYKLCLN
jgi:hypothetical protein